MAKYRKKPVVIEAVQFDGSYESAARIVDWSGGGCSATNGDGTLTVATSEGAMKASPNDWIIKGVKGEFYPCKPNVFEATYEPA